MKKNIHTHRKGVIVSTTFSYIYLTVLLLFSILSSSSAIFSSALAASEIPFNNQHVKGAYASDSFTGTICGVTDTFTEKAHLTQFHFLQITNKAHPILGHVIFQWTQTVKVYDSNGKLIATSPIMRHTTGNLETDRFHQILKAPVTCTGASETPGKSSHICFRISISLHFDPELSWKVTDYHAVIC